MSKPLTQNFYTWFGQSVFKTDAGQPSIFYHKSRATQQFTEFKNTGIDKDPYNQCAGFYFVSEHAKHAIQHLAPNGIEFYCYLRMCKPFYVYPNSTGVTDMLGNYYEPFEITNAFIDWLQTLGFDGVVVQNSGPGAHTEFVVFEPNQIKSIDNNGQFSVETNNIFE